MEILKILKLFKTDFIPKLEYLGLGDSEIQDENHRACFLFRYFKFIENLRFI